MQADFWRPDPIMLPSTLIVGLTPSCVNASRWYALQGNSRAYRDKHDFNTVDCFQFENLSDSKSEPSMKRSIAKLKGIFNRC